MKNGLTTRTEVLLTMQEYMRRISLIGLAAFILTCEKPVEPVELDTTPPTVVITYPPNGAIVVDTVIVTVEAYDDEGIDHIDFYIDGNHVYADSLEPYYYTWLSRIDADSGLHTIYVKATDSSGYVTTTEPIVVTVNDIVFQTPALPKILMHDISTDKTITRILIRNNDRYYNGLQYIIDWGDNTNLDTTFVMPFDSLAQIDHRYSSTGNYNVIIDCLIPSERQFRMSERTVASVHFSPEYIVYGSLRLNNDNITGHWGANASGIYYLITTEASKDNYFIPLQSTSRALIITKSDVDGYRNLFISKLDGSSKTLLAELGELDNISDISNSKRYILVTNYLSGSPDIVIDINNHEVVSEYEHFGYRQRFNFSATQIIGEIGAYITVTSVDLANQYQSRLGNLFSGQPTSTLNNTYLFYRSQSTRTRVMLSDFNGTFTDTLVHNLEDYGLEYASRVYWTRDGQYIIILGRDGGFLTVNLSNRLITLTPINDTYISLGRAPLKNNKLLLIEAPLPYTPGGAYLKIYDIEQNTFEVIDFEGLELRGNASWR